MKDSLSKYLANCLAIALFIHSNIGFLVEQSFITRTINKIEELEIELLKAGVSESAISRLVKMCTGLARTFDEHPESIPESYKIKLRKIIHAVPLKKDL